MKSFWIWFRSGYLGRAPQGARGLKSFIIPLNLYSQKVAPRKGRVG